MLATRLNFVFLNFLQMYFGIDWEGPVPASNDLEQVEVPDISTPSFINNTDLDNLTTTYTLEAIIASDSHAVDLYVQ